MCCTFNTGGLILLASCSSATNGRTCSQSQFQHILVPSSSAWGTPCISPALLSQGISEARACRGEDLSFGPAAAQMHKDQSNHKLLPPTSPHCCDTQHKPTAAWQGKRRHCTSQARLNDLLKVTLEKWDAAAGI